MNLEAFRKDPLQTNTVEAVLDGLAHLLILPERLTFVYGVGGSSGIRLAKLDESSQTPRDVAVKVLGTFAANENRIRLVTRLAEELKIWAGLKHPNVLEIVGFSLGPHNDIEQLMSPYLINGSVVQYMSAQTTAVGIEQRIRFVRDVTAGLDFLHSQSSPICHGSLKPSKILISDNLDAVLSGFGLPSVFAHSGDLSGLTTTRPVGGATRYISSELLLQKQTMPTLESDVWAWACSVFEILTDVHPFFQAKTDVNVLRSINQQDAPGEPKKVLHHVPDAPKPEFASVLRALSSYLPDCWSYDPSKRPKISLLWRHFSMFPFGSDSGDTAVKATLKELRHLLVPPDRLRMIERSGIGGGTYGEVVIGTLDSDSPSPRDVAVKKLRAVGTRGDRIRLAKRLARELNIWARIRHRNIVELIGYHLDENYETPLLISELMVNGNVLAYIQRTRPGIGQRVAFAKGITAGLACLHNSEPPICHADLKPENVLIDSQLNAVLCDFGLASFVKGSDDTFGLATSTSFKGTPRYMCPELLFNENEKHTLESDAWAWACTVFQIVTGRLPYAEAAGEVPFCLAISKKTPPGNANLLLPENFEDADSETSLSLCFLHSTILQCWDFDPNNRPSISALLSHFPGSSSEEEVPSKNPHAVFGDLQADLQTQTTPGRVGPEWADTPAKDAVPMNTLPSEGTVLKKSQESRNETGTGQAGVAREELDTEDLLVPCRGAMESAPDGNSSKSQNRSLAAFTVYVACIIAVGAIACQWIARVDCAPPDQESMHTTLEVGSS